MYQFGRYVVLACYLKNLQRVKTLRVSYAYALLTENDRKT